MKRFGFRILRTLFTLISVSLVSCTSLGSQLSATSSAPVPMPFSSSAANCTQSAGLAPTGTCVASCSIARRTVQFGERDTSACQGPSPFPTTFIPTPAPPTLSPAPPALSPAPSNSGMKWVVYTEGGVSLSNIPKGVTCVDLAFGSLTGSKVQFDPSGFGGAGLKAAIQALHQQGVVVMVSLGGAGGAFSYTGDAATFMSSLKSVLQTNGLDGVDFDDEQDQGSARAQTINAVIAATQQMYTQMGQNGLITLAAYGGSPTDFGDGAIMTTSGNILSWVNLMAYASDVGSIQGMTTPYDGMIAPNKLVVGGICSDCSGPLPTSGAQQLATWVKSKGYGGVMMWTIDSGQQYVQPVASILGT
jgi:Glycosyl hydrolases family 18